MSSSRCPIDFKQNTKAASSARAAASLHLALLANASCVSGALSLYRICFISTPFSLSLSSSSVYSESSSVYSESSESLSESE